MKKAQTAVVKPPLKTVQDERTRAHRSVNWVVSIILLVFAIWSIHLNSETIGVYKQNTQLFLELDAKMSNINQGITTVTELCQKTTVVVPVAPTDTEKNQ